MKKKKIFYTNYDLFAKRVGILSEESLQALGWKCDNGNRICFSQLQELINFVEKLNNPSNAERFIEGKKAIPKKYHICTDYDASDAEEAYSEQNNVDEGIRVVATIMTNDVGYVNRMDYFLCDGDADQSLYLEEIEEI